MTTAGTEAAETFDVVVIGAGAAGENAAGVAASYGLNVAIVENELVGGECSYWACVPSKTLLSPGKLLEMVRQAPGLRAALDPAAVLARRDSMVANWDDSGQVDWLDGVGVTLIRGHARLTGERRVDVHGASDTRTLHASAAVVIATGSRPVSPDIAGLGDVETWDSRNVTSARSVPESIIFVGGGPVGVEMAQAWNWLGTRTTLVHNAARLLKSEEPFVSDELTEALGEQGIEVITQADATAIRRLDGAVELEIDASDGSSTVRKAEQVVIAVGRRPNTDDVGVESVGLEPGTTLEVDDHMRALGMDWLYAVGDVNGRAQLTHMGKYQARVAGAHIAGKDAAVASVSATPRVVFTSPEIAAVGLTEQRATEDGIAVDTVTFDLGQVSAATVLGEGRSGTAKLVIDRDRHIVLGATFTGPQAGELVHSATIAIVGEVPLSRLWHAVPAFPTLSEVWLRLLESYRDRGWDPYG